MSPEVPAGTPVGWGFDAHPLDGRPPMILGGVVVSDSVGVVATSDGDVLSHAIVDAVLGACVLSDIGEHFPSDDPRWQDSSSLYFVEEAARLARDAGWQVAHVDATVVVERVRVAPHRGSIRAKLAEALGIEVDALSVKATTTDGLGIIGRGEGVAAVAVVTVTALP
jgi:2-C-methyl-D-erythritol 2,4-cyclodiphosphate synthase